MTKDDAHNFRVLHELTAEAVQAYREFVNSRGFAPQEAMKLGYAMRWLAERTATPEYEPPSVDDES